jgi:hypothetical protein
MEEASQRASEQSREMIDAGSRGARVVVAGLIALSPMSTICRKPAGGIQANHLVDRLAAETEPVIDDVWTT